MPLRHGKGFYQWGNSNKKYYYKSEAERKNAKRRAILQGYAIEKSEERAGKPSHLARSKSTGRKTRLLGTKSRSGSKTSKPRTSKSRTSKSKSRGSKTSKPKRSRSRNAGSKTARSKRSGSKTTKSRKSGSKTSRSRK